jgi:hypothetical protein
VCSGQVRLFGCEWYENGMSRSRIRVLSRAASVSWSRRCTCEGIGADGPSFPFAESVEDERVPVAAGGLAGLCEYVERFDRLRRVRVAALDSRPTVGGSALKGSISSPRTPARPARPTPAVGSARVNDVFLDKRHPTLVAGSPGQPAFPARPPASGETELHA